MFLGTQPELIWLIIREIEGFGDKRTRAVIDAFPTLTELLNEVLNRSPEEIREEVGGRKISLKNANNLKNALAELVDAGTLDPSSSFESNREAWINHLIKKEFKDIAYKKYEVLNDITVDNLNFNPFLLRLLRFETPEDIAGFMVAERLERGIVTSYGARIQNIIRMFASDTGVEGADICKIRNDIRNYIQIKAGPNTINKDITSEINQLLSSATRRNRRSHPLLGMTYGNKERVSQIIQRYAQVEWIVGAEFWEFITDDPDYAHRLFEIAEAVGSSIPEGERPFQEKYRDKVAEVAFQIRKKYGEGSETWENLFRDNM